MKVLQAINAVQAALAEVGIGKDKTANTGGGGSYRFRGIDDVYNALAPLLAKNGLVIVPRMLSRESVERVNRNGNAIFYVTVEAEFDFHATEDGSKVTARSFGEAMDSSDKATNKAMSAAYKYAAFQTFCIPTEAQDVEQDDHNVIAAAAHDVLIALREAAMQGTAALRAAYTEAGKANAKVLNAVWQENAAALKQAAEAADRKE